MLRLLLTLKVMMLEIFHDCCFSFLVASFVIIHPP